MPRVKKPQRVFGIHRAVANEVEGELRKRGIDVPDVLPALARVVCYADSRSVKGKVVSWHKQAWQEDKRVWTRFCERCTKESMAVLEVLFRKVEQSHRESGVSRIARFLLSHNTLVRHGGKWHRIGELPEGVGEKRWIHEFTAGEIATYLSECGDTVEEELVKKVRQQLSKGK